MAVDDRASWSTGHKGGAFAVLELKLLWQQASKAQEDGVGVGLQL